MEKYTEPKKIKFKDLKAWLERHIEYPIDFFEGDGVYRKQLGERAAYKFLLRIIDWEEEPEK